jgi:hypothetical protein
VQALAGGGVEREAIANDDAGVHGGGFKRGTHAGTQVEADASVHGDDAGVFGNGRELQVDTAVDRGGLDQPGHAAAVDRAVG